MSDVKWRSSHSNCKCALTGSGWGPAESLGNISATLTDRSFSAPTRQANSRCETCPYPSVPFLGWHVCLAAPRLHIMKQNTRQEYDVGLKKSTVLGCKQLPGAAKAGCQKRLSRNAACYSRTAYQYNAMAACFRKFPRLPTMNRHQRHQALESCSHGT